MHLIHQKKFQDYLHEFVALEYCCSVKDQLAVFNVIFEGSHRPVHLVCTNRLRQRCENHHDPTGDLTFNRRNDSSSCTEDVHRVQALVLADYGLQDSQQLPETLVRRLMEAVLVLWKALFFGLGQMVPPVGLIMLALYGRHDNARGVLAQRSSQLTTN
ncbi:hypothetical protein EYF80_024639 [Liparis tanakae]|uniref:Uncharacterized protein n=1 Tax=Liparis tanakae TaxID=230148 RepID=A0A4Z2HHW7_9TELE|nr:hypothetical protein EYF80_024639 [Liparis tanakae]